MAYKTTKVRIRSGGQKLGMFLAEDILDHSVYTLGKDSCEWFSAIHVGNILNVVAKSDGTIFSVLGLSKHPIRNEK